ncbi:MAG: 4-hydroxythreonine-4-phosphate dehydrogenase PdxA, partial [Bryobacteraceae bacterium]
MKPRIGVFAGDPTGIGPELTEKLLAHAETSAADVVPVGAKPRDGEYEPGKLSAAAGAYVLASLRDAAAMLTGGEIDALCYAPLNKQAMKLGGLACEDELQYFAQLLGHRGLASEINVCGDLWTSRVTSHVPLRSVAALITEERILGSARLLNQAMRASGRHAPRIAVAALNPHAGEGGLLGTEEITTIGPDIARARAEGIDATGPLPADTLFLSARRGDFDGVVSMYHDQGQ